MQKLILVVVAAVAGVLLTAAPGTAAPTLTGAEWEPVHYDPWELPAGERCEFAIRNEPVVNEVRKRVLETYPDGSPKREQYTGELIAKFTNLETGAYTYADASGDAMVEYRTDGSMMWYVNGPVLVGFREGGGNLPKGVWIIDGVFSIEFAPDGYRTVTMARGATHNLCTDVD